MKAEEILVGTFVFWEDLDQFGGWSCPGIVKAFDGRVATITTFDDFKTGECSLLENLRLTSVENVRCYLRTRKTEEENRVEQLLKQIKNIKALITQYQAKLDELLNQ